VTRYLRLYLCFLRFSFSRAMEFRLDFFFRIGMDALWYAVNLAFFWVLYQHMSKLGDWTYDQVVVFIAGMFVVDALHMTIFSNNMWWLPILINKGDLDYYLVRPVSPLFFLSLRDFAANSFVNLLMAVGVLAWALARYPAPLAVASIACYVALLLLGAFLLYVLYLIFLIPSFWMHTAHGLREIFFSLEHSASRPHRMFGGWARKVLLSLLPFAFMASIPAQALFEGITPAFLLHLAAVNVIAFLVMRTMWKAGLRSYASASS
jgi:ABC-2 type transport system permease protein